MTEKLKGIRHEHMGHKIPTLKTAFETNGIRGLTDSIAADLLAWRKTEIKVALTGTAGAGKSTFINTIRGLDSDSKGAAATGPTKTTTEIIPYSLPSNKNILLVELPGAGTERFARETYLKETHYEIFDFFFIVSQRGFLVDDIWLAKEIEAGGRQIYFIRTKFDVDLMNVKKGRGLKRPLNLSEQDELKTTILDDLRRRLMGLKCKDNIFIIDSFERNKFDFPELENRLKHNCINQEVIISSLEVLIEEAINKKKSIFWKLKTALNSVVAPSATDDDVVFLEKVKEIYLEQFNLDADSLKHDASLANITDDKFSEVLEILNLEEDITQEKTCTDEMLSLYYYCPSLII